MLYTNTYRYKRNRVDYPPHSVIALDPSVPASSSSTNLRPLNLIEATACLQNLRKKQLRRLSQELGIRVTARMTNAELVTNIIEEVYHA